ncbi:probable carboxylesterase 1 [Arachis stenosperma]|uniref:probable carboxylesterase 1 n=1 Tax=Arachis stenosperma TaxID=217475 RepID=UPI0025AC2471|nr:probable carboxylesterase 1 [Arachis stenosperma]
MATARWSSISLSTATIKKRRVEATMEEKEVSLEFPFFRVYKDGGVELLHSPPVFYPPSDVKDTVISSDQCAPVSARIFLPKTPNRNNKLPVLLFFHGSGFCANSAFTEEYSNHVAAIANEAKVLAISVEYAKFPARPPPECYEDAWRSLQWVVSHADGDGPELWLNDLADLQRVFIAGSGTGGNLSHWVASLVGKTVLPRRVSVEGAILVHPFFGGIGDDDQWLFMCKEKNGPEDPRLKPRAEDLQSLGCKRVLVCVAEKDPLLVAGRNYVTALKKSGWSGSVELVEHQGLGHCEHVYKPYEDNSRQVLKKIASFINEKNCRC